MPFNSDNAKPTTSNEVNQVSSSADSGAPAAHWAQDAWSKGVNTVKEHPVLTAGAAIAAGLVIHNRNIIVNGAAIEVNARTVAVPMLKTIEIARDIVRTEFKASEPLAKLYSSARASIGKIEGFSRFSNELSFNSGTAFSVSKDGKLLTANHVVSKALDFSVVDAKGAVHEARVVAIDAYNDLAVLQLTNPASFKAFKPMRLAENLPAKLKESDLFALGHPDMVNEVVMSVAPQNGASTALQAGDTIFSTVLARPGNSGGPLVNMAGEVVGVNRTVMSVMGEKPVLWSTTSVAAKRLLAGITEVKPATENVFADETVRQWLIPDQHIARTELNKLLGRSLDATPGEMGFHSKLTNISSNNGFTISLRSSLNPAKREFSVRPVAVNDQPIDEMMRWGKNISMKNAELVVKLNRKMNPVQMVAHNDPMDVLRYAFPRDGGYLANLESSLKVSLPAKTWL